MTNALNIHEIKRVIKVEGEYVLNSEEQRCSETYFLNNEHIDTTDVRNILECQLKYHHCVNPASLQTSLNHEKVLEECLEIINLCMSQNSSLLYSEFDDIINDINNNSEDVKLKIITLIDFVNLPVKINLIYAEKNGNRILFITESEDNNLIPDYNIVSLSIYDITSEINKEINEFSDMSKDQLIFNLLKK